MKHNRSMSEHVVGGSGVYELKRAGSVFLLFMLLTTAFDVQSTRADTSAQVVAARTYDVNVKLVFVGISATDLDLNYMSWSENLPRTVNTQVIIGGKDLGTTAKIGYQFAFAPSVFKERLISYLESIAKTENLRNPAFTYYEKEGERRVQKYMDVKSTYYDANEVHAWLKRNSDAYDWTAPDSWTLVLMYLPELPSATYEGMRKYQAQNENMNTTDVHPHYYSTVSTDIDLGYALRYRQFMTGWGNLERFWFLDLSAGPSFWSWEGTLPLQVVLKDQKVELGSSYGRNWLTEYLADYIYGAVMNFVVPFPVYYPTYATRYKFHASVFDDRTAEEKDKIPIEKTVNKDKIKEAFEELLPYAKANVEISYRNTENYPALKKIIRDNTAKVEDAVFQGSIDVVDVRPVYYHLQRNLQTYLPSVKGDESEVVVLVFAFAFSEQSLFSYSYKWDHSRRDPERPALLGISMEDMVLISLNQWYFTRGDEVGQKGKGLGFTQTIIHEVGHSLGLMHPHSYDSIGDFSYSAMGYFTNDYGFGQSDRDSLRRTHADQFMLETMVNLVEARTNLESKIESKETMDSIDKTENQLKAAEQDYNQLRYAEAVAKAIEARQSSFTVLSQVHRLPEATIPLREQLRTYVPASLIIGIGTGVCITCIGVKVKSRKKKIACSRIVLGSPPEMEEKSRHYV